MRFQETKELNDLLPENTGILKDWECIIVLLVEMHYSSRMRNLEVDVDGQVSMKHCDRRV
jgi:hypothetical protein